MDNIKTIGLCLTIVVSFSIMILIVKYLTKKIREAKDFAINLSYGLWVTTLIIAYSVLLSKTVWLLSEVFDLVYKLEDENKWTELFKMFSLFIGINTVWFLVWYWVSGFLYAFTFGRRNEIIEGEVNNLSYFLLRGAFLIGLTISSVYPYEVLLRTFSPTISLPMYH